MTREQSLDNWLSQHFETNNFKRVPLAGDASFRCYYRIFIGRQQYVVMDAPPPEVPKIFVDIARALTNQDVSVPEVIATELEQGFLLLSDLGDRLYLSELNPQSADVLYTDAFQALLKIQCCRVDVPCFDSDFLKRQLGIFQEWYLGRHQDKAMNSTLQNIIHPIYEQLCETILLQPQVFVHRDYHSRNLMVLENESPGVLDFQDAMIGPITYDLVSLLQDCYIDWPRQRVIDWVKDFQYRAEKIGLLSGQESSIEFLRWFDWTGLQRHLKNLGIFARLHYRDGKSQYLKDIPRLLYYIHETCSRYPELRPLGHFFESLSLAETVEG